MEMGKVPFEEEFCLLVVLRKLKEMIGIIEKQRAAIEALCLRFKVQRLELFGSALTNDHFDEQNSDLDFLVEFLPLQHGQHADTYFGLLEALENLFGRNIDLVMTTAIKNPYFLESVNQSRRVIYAA